MLFPPLTTQTRFGIQRADEADDPSYAFCLRLFMPGSSHAITAHQAFIGRFDRSLEPGDILIWKPKIIKVAGELELEIREVSSLASDCHHHLLVKCSVLNGVRRGLARDLRENEGFTIDPVRRK